VTDVFVHDVQTGQTTRVSVSSDGIQANGRSYGAALSANGRYIAFSSEATDLMANDGNGDTADVFVHDQQTGQTILVSVSSDGTQGNDWSGGPALSADGRYVAFASWSTNLTDDPVGLYDDIFVHDRQTGQTTCASVDFGPAGGVAISAGGQFVAYTGFMPTEGEYSLGDIFRHSRLTKATTLVSRALDGTYGNEGSGGAAISADGCYVAFDSWASDLLAGDSNGVGDIFVWYGCHPAYLPLVIRGG
jgi:Tol biopolymer transport system component